MAQALRADAGRPRSGLAAAGEEGASSLPLHSRNRIRALTGAPPRPNDLSIREDPAVAPASPAPHRPQCTGRAWRPNTVIHPGAHVIGWERVDADTTQRRPTSAPTTREAADPNPSPVPSPIAPPQRGIRAPRERRPRPRPLGREVFDSCDLPQSFPVMQRWVGWASRDRRGADQAVDARQTPLGRKWKERSGEKVRNRESKGENRGLIPSYLISDLPETHVHACQRRYRNGVRGLPSHPPVAVHSRRPRVAPSWARPHSW